MNELYPFNYSGHDIRTVKINGEPWFVATDICDVLDLASPRSSLALLDEDEKGVHSVDTPGGPQGFSIVNEPGLYSLILRSRKPEAKRFKRWITHEVIPTIRKTGMYGQLEQRLSRRELAEYWVDAERQLEAAEAKVAELAEPAHSWNQLAEASGDYSMREAAQILDRDPAINTGQNRLARYLREIGWCDRTGTPYQDQVDLGRIALRTRTYPHPRTGEQQTSRQVRIAAKGLHELHKRLGGQGPLLLAA